MRKGILSTFLLVFLITGCANTAQEYEIMFAEFNKEYHELASNLPHLKSANISINARKIEYDSTFNVTKSFGDLSFSEKRKSNYLDLLNPDFSRLSVGIDCFRKAAPSEKAAVNCFKGFQDYHERISAIMTELSVESAKEGFRKIYTSLKGLDSLVSVLNEWEKDYLAVALSQEFKEKYTLDEFAEAIDSFVAQHSPEQFKKLVRTARKNKRAEELELLLEREREAHRIRQEKAKRIRMKKIMDEINEADKLVWENRKKYKYSIGNKVCSYENDMGFVEKLGGLNIKILIIGKALERPGYFFGNNPNQDSQFQYTTMNKIIWMPKAGIAPCSFSYGT